MKKKIICFIILIAIIISYFLLTSNLSLEEIMQDTIILSTEDVDKNILNPSVEKEYISQNIEIKDIIEIDNYDVVYASIVYNNDNEVVIDKGTIDGINEDLVVITKNGLVGKINSSGLVNSEIKLLTSLDNKLLVSINNKNKVLFEINNELFIKGINEEDNIKVGDLITTSGLSDIYPEGILIGTIKELNKNNDSVGYTAKVELSTDLNNLKYVAILKKNNIYNLF